MRSKLTSASRRMRRISRSPSLTASSVRTPRPVSLLERGVEFAGQLVEHKPSRITGLRGSEQLAGRNLPPVRPFGAGPPCSNATFPPMTALPIPRAVPIPQVADAEAKQLQLDRMKRRATGLLVLMSAVFSWPWSWSRGTPGSATSGPRRRRRWWAAWPTGSPSPPSSGIRSTSRSPTPPSSRSRKDRIGRSLGNFVQNNFLSPEVLGAKLRAMQPSRRARSGSGGRRTPARSPGMPPGASGAPPTWCGTRTCTPCSSGA